MATKTALEWFIEQIPTMEILVDKELHQKAIEIFEKAKAMEKEQIVNAYLQKRRKQSMTGVLKNWDAAEQYYTETYGN
jgi:hypothetical protein